MSESPLQVYRVSVSGLWTTRHEFSSQTESGWQREGVLTVERSSTGRVTGAEYRPEKGEVLSIRRDPGLLRSQFSLWTDGQEWLGSSLRWGLRRQIDLSTGSKPLYLLPVAGLRAGWGVYAPKSGENARILSGLLGRGARIEVLRRFDFPILVFAYFLGNQVHLESILPGPEPEKVKARASATAV
ncbi:MAG: hypothetical protein R3F34_08100 [Planctomycetota bacterium]